MALTPDELQSRLDSLIGQWERSFKPLELAVAEIRGEMSVRIFGSGSSVGKNTAGATLPTKSYKTKPAYFDPRSLPSVPSQLQIGKRGKRIKSVYAEGGYAQLKSVLGRPPLELTNALDSAFTNLEGDNPLRVQGDSVAIVVPDSEDGKIEGLEKLYGTIFQMSDEETTLFFEILSDYIADALNKALE